MRKHLLFIAQCPMRICVIVGVILAQWKDDSCSDSQPSVGQKAMEVLETWPHIYVKHLKL